MLTRIKKKGKVVVAIFIYMGKKPEHVFNLTKVKKRRQVMKSRVQDEESALYRRRDIYSSEIQRNEVGMDSVWEAERR